MPPAERKPRVLFLCTGNSCRSQMAEGWARALKPGLLEACSAGTHPHGLDPLAVRVMREAGVDIAQQRSKRVADVGEPVDIVVTVCKGAGESCPTLPGRATVHVGFDDPPALARGASCEDDALAHYRRVRDQIRAFIEALPGSLGDRAAQAFTHAPGGAPMNSQSDRTCCAAGCCENAPASSDPAAAVAAQAQSDAVREQVREGYARIAQTGGWNAVAEGAPSSGCCGGGSAPAGGCCGPATFSPGQLAAAIGYTAGELASAPEGANMGLSCGNPTAIAALQQGETVVDLGAGGGFDCFVAGPKVGPTGRVIGVDMTPDMVSKARRNTAIYASQTGLHNVEFRLGEIENLPIADASVDVVISNCVLNLSPDKARVWQEIARVLKPGGRAAVSDLALLRPLPQAVLQSVTALVGCVAGAVLVEETRRHAHAAGLVDIVLTPKPEYIDAMTNWEDPLYRTIVESLPAGTKPSDFITSLDVSARRAAR